MKKKIASLVCAIALVFSLLPQAEAKVSVSDQASPLYEKGAYSGVTTSSPYIYKVCKVDRQEYGAVSFCFVDPDYYDGGSYAGAGVQVNAEGYIADNVPAGYMGGEPRMYLDGELWLAEGWSYSNGIGTSFQKTYQTYFTSRWGIVYAKSKFGLYNGNGYDIYDTYSTPNLDIAQIPPRQFIIPELENKIDYEFGTNANGQTYGSGWLDTTPDLIKAIGVGGVHGYVLDAELTQVGLKNSPDEILTDIPTTIPLYDKDGITVIGEFALSCSN